MDPHLYSNAMTHVTSLNCGNKATGSNSPNVPVLRHVFSGVPKLHTERAVFALVPKGHNCYRASPWLTTMQYAWMHQHVLSAMNIDCRICRMLSDNISCTYYARPDPCSNVTVNPEYTKNQLKIHLNQQQNQYYNSKEYSHQQTAQSDIIQTNLSTHSSLAIAHIHNFIFDHSACGHSQSIMLQNHKHYA